MSLESEIIDLTRATVSNMLTFKTTVDIQSYVINKTHAEFREFETQVAINNPIKGTGVLATRSNILTTKIGGKEYYHNDVYVGAHELGAYIGLYPLEAASASYIFTILETFGDTVADKVNPGSLAGGRSWHQDIKDRYDFRDSVQAQKARESFGKCFRANWNDVPEIAPLRMVSIKRARNEFAHQGTDWIDFDDFISDALAVVCHITFLTTNIDRISIYPWEDYLELFRPKT